eukprot:scaffold12772_cov126-Isochrysis_galbana.AAC.6
MAEPVWHRAFCRRSRLLPPKPIPTPRPSHASSHAGERKSCTSRGAAACPLHPSLPPPSSRQSNPTPSTPPHPPAPSAHGRLGGHASIEPCRGQGIVSERSWPFLCFGAAVELDSHSPISVVVELDIHGRQPEILGGGFSALSLSLS